MSLTDVNFRLNYNELMSNIDTARLEDVCSRLGNATTDPAMWPEILEQISAAVGATGAVIVQSDARTSDVPRSAGITLSSATNALNAVPQPAIAIDRLGFVLDANPAAEALFDQYIRVKDRRLVVDDAQTKACLEVLVDRFRVTPDTATLLCEPIVIHRREKRPVILRTLPVHAAARTPFLSARAVLTLTTVEPRVGPKPALLSKALGLTPAEARLASIIAEGLPPERAAEELAISKATARNQLKAIFAKTGTHRQGELVALLSRL
jgi:DNA-binding CsgD family transcriptional regulator